MKDIKEKIKRNFSRSAKSYDDYASLHKEIAKRVLSDIPEKGYKYILDIGTGTGFLAYGLAERFKKAKIFAIDLAPGMVEHARAKNPYPNIQFQEGDGEKIPFGKETFDLAVSSSSLQWMNCNKCFLEVKRVLKPEGDFYFSMFGPKTLCELKEVMGNKTILEKLKGIKSYSEIKQEIFPDFMALLNFIKGLGAQSGPVSLGLESRKVLANAEKEYNKRYGCERGIIATFEIIYGSMRRE